MMRTATCLLVALALAGALCSTAPASWPPTATDAVLICDETGNQWDVEIIEDGEGGAIITWADYRTVDGNIHAQRLSGTGDALWAEDGVRLCNASYNQDRPELVSDGAGGAIIAWVDARSGSDYDLYARRVDSSGDTLWATNGAVVCTSGLYEDSVVMCSDGAGGAIIAWHDGRNTVDYDVYAQRMDAEGNALWTPGGVAVCNASGNQNYPRIISDGEGGAFVAWVDYRGADADIRATRINSSGGNAWGGELGVCTASSSQAGMQMASDGFGGAIVVWEDYRGASPDIYAQSFASNGSIAWTSDGVAVCQATNIQSTPMVVSDGVGGAIIAWDDYRTTPVFRVYAQRVSTWGATLWTSDGIRLSHDDFTAAGTRIVSDGAGGAVVAWAQIGLGGYDIAAQRIDESGNELWQADGVVVALAPGMQAGVEVACDLVGGAIMVWKDQRLDFLDDLFAQRVDRHGYLGLANPAIVEVIDYPGDQGGTAIVSWAPSYLDAYPEQVVSHYSVWRRIPPEHGAAAKSAALSEPGDVVGYADALERSGWSYVGEVTASYLEEYAYDAPTYGDSTASGTPLTEYMVIANTDDNWVFWESNRETGYSVDNLAPGAPLALAAQGVQTDVELVWSAGDYHDEDLAVYNVYRSATAGFTPSEVTFVGMATDTVYTDAEPGGGTWYYLVTAEDVHGNEGDPSNEASANAWVGIDDVMPTVLAIRGNAPNPFNPVTTIAYDLPESGHVRLDVYTADGSLVATVEDGFREAGRRQAVWNGTNPAGSEMPSGVYFARLAAGDETAVHRMVLLK
jgi:hypothetical protein